MPASLTQYSAPLHIQLKFSRSLAGFIACSHLSALLAVLLCGCANTWLALSLSGLIALHAILVARRYLYFTEPNYPCCFVVFSHPIIELFDGRTATQLPATLIHPWLCVLHLRLQCGRRVYWLIVYDALEHETFRVLRVRLRHRCEL